MVSYNLTPKEEACEIADETIKLMDKYKTEIENALAMESYLSS